MKRVLDLLKKETNINLKINYTTVLFLLTLFIYIVWSIVMISARIPFFDEINAWNIAANCRISELFEVTKVEGHLLIWYLIIKPFAINGIGFPYVIYAINWIFAFISVLVLWFFAPFKAWTKMFITFSLPVQMFSCYARCYSIGMMILFIICALYKKRLEHPIVYSILLVLLANTSIMGAVATFALGLIFATDIFDSIKNKTISHRTISYSIIILVLGAALVLFQLTGCSIPEYSVDKDYLNNKFYDFFHIWHRLPKDTAIFLFYFLMFFCIRFFINDRKPYFFMLCSLILTLYIGTHVYGLCFWHYMFAFLYIISSIWIYMDSNEVSTNYQKFYKIIFNIFCFCLIFFFVFKWQWNGFHKSMQYFLQENIKEYNHSYIFMYPTDSSVIGLIPMTKDFDINYFDAHGNSFKTKYAYLEQWQDTEINFEQIKNQLKDSKYKTNAYMLVSTSSLHEEKNKLFKKICKEKNHTNLDFKLHKQLKYVYIYKITLRGNKNEKN